MSEVAEADSDSESEQLEFAIDQPSWRTDGTRRSCDPEADPRAQKELETKVS
jgi:hypothetical protein